MQYYLRFLCYDGPDRHTTKQIHPDIPIDEPPKCSYGQSVRIGNTDDDPATWPKYNVAHIPHMQQIKDPADSGKNALLVELFLARYEEWPQFIFPKMVFEPIGSENQEAA